MGQDMLESTCSKAAVVERIVVHIQRQLEFLKQERDEVLGFKRSGEMKTQTLLKQAETQRQRIVSEFQQVRQLLEEKQRLLLAQLDEINKDILKRQNNYIAKITEEISRLDHLISELKGKCQQPASEFLQEKIQAHLESLREDREKLLGFKETGEGKSQTYLQLQQFLQKQERLLLARLENLEKEILKIQNDNVTKLSEEISCLSDQISELEGKCQKPANEFLQVRLS
ncbi:hypothetical protein KIL84_004097 [Mauremys mutica]|uniref:Uncharacterized protein n=1 Tax=Mauremys mutica TaxID=74926 RepID=A0A9D3XNZ6_9SAUR|nr:hypothetical protein KIL84_004097 [Mauremys mutica]